MKYSFGKISTVYGDWRDWFVVDQSLKKYPFKFYIGESYVGEILIPNYDKSGIYKRLEIEIIGSDFNDEEIVNQYNFSCKELEIERTNVFPPKVLAKGDTVTIVITLIFNEENKDAL